MIGVIPGAGDIAPPIRVLVLVRNVVDARAVRQAEFGVVLLERLAKLLRRRQQLMGVEVPEGTFRLTD